MHQIRFRLRLLPYPTGGRGGAFAFEIYGHLIIYGTNNDKGFHSQHRPPPALLWCDTVEFLDELLQWLRLVALKNHFIPHRPTTHCFGHFRFTDFHQNWRSQCVLESFQSRILFFGKGSFPPKQQIVFYVRCSEENAFWGDRVYSIR